MLKRIVTACAAVGVLAGLAGGSPAEGSLGAGIANNQAGHRTSWKMAQENFVIVANHPSLLEIFVIPLLFAPFYLLGIPQRIPWNISAAELFSPRLIPYLRCITVDRTSKVSLVRCFKQAANLLEERGTSLIIYPEGGRTVKGSEFVTHGTRKMRKTTKGALQLAQQTYTRIIPVYIEFPHVSTPLSMRESLMHLLRGNRMTVYLGAPCDPIGMTQDRLNELVLTTGLHK